MKKDIIQAVSPKLEKFDIRGIQTLFRTVSRNHYTLLRMIDSKAGIILTINSIVISLAMGSIYIRDNFSENELEVILKTSPKVLPIKSRKTIKLTEYEKIKIYGDTNCQCA